MKIITIINWLIIAAYGCLIMYGIAESNPRVSDAAGRGVESSLIGLAIILFIVMAGLNYMPYTWTKITALVIGILILLLAWFIKSN